MMMRWCLPVLGALLLAGCATTIERSARDAALCRAVVDRCFDSRDYAEGRSALMDKRRPLFEGR